jgi:ribosomal protein S21
MTATAGTRVEVSRGKNESSTALIRRFTRRVQGLGLVREVRNRRYWASPLPIWKAKNGKTIFVSSLEELKGQTKKSGNSYFFMRHGEAMNHIQETWTRELHRHGALTEKGKQQVRENAQAFKETPDVIIASPYERTKETAEITAEAVSFPKEKIIFDDRLKEWDVDENTLGCFTIASDNATPACTSPKIAVTTPDMPGED